MTKQDFIQYLSSPEKLNGHSVSALEKLVGEYPYFQTAHLLYLKNLHSQNSIDYEKHLGIASAYVSDRKVLYNLIRKKPSGTEQKQEIVYLEPTQQTTYKPQTRNEILPKEEPIVILQEIPVKVQQTTKTEPGKIQLPEKEMLREAIMASPAYDIVQQETSAESRQPPDPGARDKQKHSFSDWMKVFSMENAEAGVLQQNEPLRKKKNEIIDRFILEETAKTPAKPKKEFYSAEAMAKKSLQDDETFITETLANIYLKQGNLPKALRAYEILLIKHPEKFHIFAPLLEKIKKQIQMDENRFRQK